MTLNLMTVLPIRMMSQDIFVSRGNAINLVGRAAVYEGKPQQCAFPDLLIRIRVDQLRLNPRFLAYYFHSRRAREYIEGCASGTSPTMKKVSQPKLGAMPVPVIDIEIQKSIISTLDEVRSRIGIDILQQNSLHELRALIPSLIDRGIRGLL